MKKSKLSTPKALMRASAELSLLCFQTDASELHRKNILPILEVAGHLF